MDFINLDDFIAGWFGGICGLVVAHPMDTIKIRQQTYGSNFKNTFKRTYHYEGILGFYKGVLFPFLTYGLANSIFFGTYSNIMRILDDYDKKVKKIDYKSFNENLDVLPIETNSKIKHHFFAGACAGFCQNIFYVPVELIKTVMQTKTTEIEAWQKSFDIPYKNSMDTFKTIYKNFGIKGLYRGTSVMMLRDIPTCGVYVVTYEIMMHSLFPLTEVPPLAQQMVSGGTAGVMSSIVALPVDVVKNFIQIDNPKRPIAKGVINYFRVLYKKNGVSLFTRGLFAVCTTTFIRNGIIFIAYEKMSIFLGVYGFQHNYREI